MKRRDLFKLGSMAMVGSGLMSLPSMSLGASKNFSDYKALVCFYFFGGNDGFNMVVPLGSDYDDYAASRQNMAVAKGDLLPLSTASYGNSSYGLHPQLASLQGLFNDGKLGLMANMGNLIEPVTKADLTAFAKKLPPKLFSHNDQQNQSQYLTPGQSKTGLGGRLVDLLKSSNTNQLFTGVNIDTKRNWFRNPQGSSLVIGRRGFSQYSYVRDLSWSKNRREAFLQLLEHDYGNSFTNEFSKLQKRTVDLTETIGKSINDVTFTTAKPGNNKVAEKFEMIAKVISKRSMLGASRQIFMVDMGGFDTHDAHLEKQPELYKTLADAMKYFYDLTVEQGIADKVTTFTHSEFGRTLTSNGNGTDHAWGNHQFVMGGAVRGGDIHGKFPDLAIGGSDDIRRDGRIIPTTSVEQYMESLLKWFGVTEAQMTEIMPNRGAFDTSAINLMI